MESSNEREMFALLLEDASWQSLRRQQNDQEIDDILTMLASTSNQANDSSSGESDFETEEHPKCDNFVDIIDLFGDEDFKSNMRLKRSTVDYLISRFSQSRFLSQVCGGGRNRIGPKKSMYIYIWYISNTVTFRQLGNLFGIAKSSAWVTVYRVTSFLIAIGNEYIQWPQGPFAEEVRRKFEERKKIPGIIGAIDCTHISIRAPIANKVYYFDRKQNYSLILQAVVDADKRFIDVTCGEPGSLHDSRVLRRSHLYSRALANYQELFPDASFIIGDSAYPANSWLVPPFKDNGDLTDAQRQFNYIHSSTRIVVENAFGLLKGRFRRLLKFTEQTDLRAITKIIMSACVLHNICITHDDLYSVQTQDVAESTIIVPYDGESIADSSINRREMLFSYLQQQNII